MRHCCFVGHPASVALRRGILLLGSAGSGKGTQARLLQERLGLRHLDFGACRRLAVEQGTPVGQRIAALGDLVSRGKFFGNDLANDIFVEALHSDDSDPGTRAPLLVTAAVDTIKFRAALPTNRDFELSGRVVHVGASRACWHVGYAKFSASRSSCARQRRGPRSP